MAAEFFNGCFVSKLFLLKLIFVFSRKSFDVINDDDDDVVVVVDDDDDGVVRRGCFVSDGIITSTSWLAGFWESKNSLYLRLK